VGGADTGAEKVRLRALLRERLAAQPEAERARKSAAILSRAQSERVLREAETLLLHRSLPTEVSTEALLADAVLRGQPTYAPRADGSRLRFVRVDTETRWRRSTLGVLEPESGAELSLDAATAGSWAIVVPGLAFDDHGHRLGRGGGHYDRFLAEARAAGRIHVFAVAFDVQILERIPCLAHDQPVDRIVTETRMIQAQPAE
jgi:5-formyltetrahydrofolate cyclo-ligase